MVRVVIYVTMDQYYDLYNLAYHITEHFYDDYNMDDEPCDCCGDYVETYTMEI